MRSFARIHSEELKYSISYLRWEFYEKCIRFYGSESSLDEKLILKQVDKNVGGFII